jgi:predicted amidohydrolase YtcJ
MVTREWLDAGVPVALGSDAPTTPWLRPQVTLMAALTRITYSNHTYEPAQAMTIQEALRAHTMGAAYAGHEEHIKGSIEPGKLADLVVWREDPYEVYDSIVSGPADWNTYVGKLKPLQVGMTMVGGEVIYRA